MKSEGDSLGVRNSLSTEAISLAMKIENLSAPSLLTPSIQSKHRVHMKRAGPPTSSALMPK